jgi:hypothetical protein
LSIDLLSRKPFVFKGFRAIKYSNPKENSRRYNAFAAGFSIPNQCGRDDPLGENERLY